MDENFPWSFPNIFSSILLYTDSFPTLLNTRKVCKKWDDWFKRNQIWGKFLKRRRALLFEEFKLMEWKVPGSSFTITRYRLERLLHQCNVSKLSEAEAMSLAARIYKITRQMKRNLVPPVTQGIFSSITELKTKFDESDGIKSLGPISAFIRIKVKDAVVIELVNELLGMHLTAICVDKKLQMENQELRRMVLNGMIQGQSWVYPFFNPQEEETYKVKNLQNGAAAVVYASEAEMLAALQAEQEQKAASTSRKRTLLEGQDGGPSKKSKSEQDAAEMESNIYSECKPVCTNTYFPTVLELLDIDLPMLERLLISRCSINKTLVIPRLEEILLQQDTFNDIVPTGWDAVGRDKDGNVSYKVKQSDSDIIQFDHGVVKHMENLNALEHLTDPDLYFWGGHDIRHRWSMFSDQLLQDGSTKERIRKQRVPRMPREGQPSGQIPEDVSGLQSFLAARGVSVVKK